MIHLCTPRFESILCILRKFYIALFFSLSCIKSDSNSSGNKPNPHPPALTLGVLLMSLSRPLLNAHQRAPLVGAQLNVNSQKGATH